ncbi:hypothetical protein LXL04_008016 [Taraxacum kok-saghyz]
MLYTYDYVIHGFSTQLNVEEAKLLEQQHGVISVQEELKYKLHTTRSPEFLGLEKSGMIVPGGGSDVIVGVVDTGVSPGSKPGRYRVWPNPQIMERAYEATYGPIDETLESKSPMDDDGHGIHTATTAAGSKVPGASVSGFAKGTARGMAPHARLAVYKACWVGGCFGSDILAAMETAITDGVHIISLSLGGIPVVDYTDDVVSYAAFKAVSNGIFVACSAGNTGSDPSSLSNVAPWIATIGAGTLDRDFPAYITLGKGKKFRGVSLYGGKQFSGSLAPLVFAGDVGSSICAPGSLPPGRVAGKIVMCEHGGIPMPEKSMAVKAAGDAGIIITDTDENVEDLTTDPQVIPSITIGETAGDAIKSYIAMEDNPTAMITSGGTQLGIHPSPLVATFSSRGPNPVTPEILKPDFIAPGVNILAGWSINGSPTGLIEDPLRVNLNIMSGTSVSCSHVSGLAALLKAAHPEWSPAAIRSALMTTAYSTYKNGDELEDDATRTRSTPFDHGSGHVDPVSALDPEVRRWKKYRVEDLNYPSFAVPLINSNGSNSPTMVKYTRILTNVGTPATYKVSISSSVRDVKITVEPDELTFVKKGERKVYNVTFSGSSTQSGTTSFARLTWSGGSYVVNSPIAFSWV